jgi:formamidopyrimidine-DNA glycosylase
MPELPEVETIRRGLTGVLEGHRLTEVVVARSDLRRPLPRGFAGRLRDRRVLALRRRGKYLLADLDDGWTWLIHLGMSGRFVMAPRPATPRGRHDHVSVTTDEAVELRFNDARRFGLMDLARRADLDSHPLFMHMGPEPLEPTFTGAALAVRLKGKKAPIKSALCDQRVVAGIGNIYASEALFRAGISPKRASASVQGERADRLVAAVRGVLNDALAAGGSSLRDYVQASGDVGFFQDRFDVYDRAGKPCSACGKPIRRLVQSGRSTFYCGHCQK